MKKTYPKLLLREVNKTRARFLSILLIVIIGTGFLSGLLATTPDMLLTADNYYDENHLFDINIKSNLGLTDDDVTALKSLYYVHNVMPAFVTDLSLSYGGSSYVTRIYGVPFEKRGTDGFINDFVLLDGRLPENPTECVVASPNKFTIENNDLIGRTYVISTSNKNYDTLDETYNYTELTVVGIAKSPYYMSVESEPSNVGTGQINFVMYVFPEFYSLDVYTDAFITLNGAKELNAFETEYQNHIDLNVERVKSLGEILSQNRYDSLYGEARQKIDDAIAELNEAKTELNDAEQTLADKKDELNKAKQDYFDEYDAVKKQIEDSRAYYDSVRPIIGETAYFAAMSAIEAQAQNAKVEFAKVWEKIQDGEQKLADAEADVAEARDKIAEAEQKISDAEAELNDIPEGKWYYFDRSDTVSFSSYKSNSNKIAAIARVFPVFFFFVAALVALTTMTRMVEEQRVQIGTLKALGYSNTKITAYYVGYSVIASALGSLIGVIVGSKSLPAVISNAYTMMYSTPPTITKIWVQQCVLIGIIAVSCTTVATLAACLGQLGEKPCTLMLPRPPKKGKRIFLERIPFIWSRLSFIHKVTARNIFRYKKRFYMTVCGIAGCCALLVTGFGLRDSISDIVRLQFDEIYKYNTIITLNIDNAENDDEIIHDFLQDTKTVEFFGMMHNESVTIRFNDVTEKMNVFVAKNTEDMPRLISLRTRRGETVGFDENSFVLTEKLCETLGISVGDTVTVINADGDEAEIKVSGIVENYVYSYAYTTTSVYLNAYGIVPEYKTALATIYDESEASRNAISEKVLKSDNILLMQFSQSIRDSFSKTINNINYIIAVLIISAAALAFVVLFNLTNINICERKKELATIKVLGFHEKEVASYIFREINILCVIGTIFGLLFGTWLHAFVVRTAEVDAVMFGRTVSALSYVISAALTILFALFVDMLMLNKLKKVDMVESMKANE